MIQTLINRAITDRTSPRRSTLDLPRSILHGRDAETLDRIEEPAMDAARDATHAAHEPARAHTGPPYTAPSESSGADAANNAPRAASTPAWRAFRLALLILCINIAAAALLAIVLFQPSLALLGFCVAFSMLSFTGLPMLLATVSEALANDHA